MTTYDCTAGKGTKLVAGDLVWCRMHGAYVRVVRYIDAYTVQVCDRNTGAALPDYTHVAHLTYGK